MRRITFDVYDDEKWISSTSLTLDPSMPISEPARLQIMADLSEALRVAAIAPKMQEPRSSPSEECPQCDGRGSHTTYLAFGIGAVTTVAVTLCDWDKAHSEETKP